MGDKTVLLTYMRNGVFDFNWFDNVEDMEISIIEQGIKEDEIRDMIIIDSCRNIELSSECKAYMEK
jgi:hypothetical protein